MSARIDDPSVLIFSLRNIFENALNRCSHYEFENIICEIDSAELLAPRVDSSSARASFATRLAYHAPIALNPGMPRISAKRQYDLLFTICAYPQDLIMFNAVSNLSEMCKTSICLLDELWISDIFKHRHFIPILAKFDVIMQHHSQTVKPLSELIGRRCVYLPPAVDATLFCPYPNPPVRVVDVYSIGRRSNVTHQQLLAMSRESGLFYVYDTIRGGEAISLMEHRAQFANTAKRSRYFLVNPGKFDAHETGRQVEFGYRYFEGASSGAIMVGERPNNEAFPKLFDWPDAVIELHRDSSNIDELIKELDRDPQRQDRIRRTGVTQCLMRHDWVYRWEAILEAAGLEPMRGARERKDRLKRLAEAIPNQCSEADVV